MEKIKNELLKTITAAYDKFISLSEEITSIKLSTDKWTLKEIIGHLIDSASNNHQRFVRLQTETNLHFPAYHYTWIDIEKFNNMKFSDLLMLWKQYNILLAHIISCMKKNVLTHVWLHENGKQISLETLVTDYLHHLKGHIDHFEERLQEVEKA